MIAPLSDEIVEHLPQLRSFARMIARDRSLADDLVQETVLRALVHADQFRPGTHLKAWLSTILRNAFFDEKRSQKRLAQVAATLTTAPRTICVSCLTNRVGISAAWAYVTLPCRSRSTAVRASVTRSAAASRASLSW